MSALAKLLSARRAHYRISLVDAASLLGISKGHLWSLEKGRNNNPTLELVARIAHEYRLSADEILRIVRSAR